MLSAALDVFRLRQYFNVATTERARWSKGVRDDAGFLTDAGRADAAPARDRRPRMRPASPFPPMSRFDIALWRPAHGSRYRGDGRERRPRVGGRRGPCVRGRRSPAQCPHLGLLGFRTLRVPDRRRHPGGQGWEFTRGSAGTLSISTGLGCTAAAERGRGFAGIRGGGASNTPTAGCSGT